ncbi:unnamed protein product [Meganyctiphanes norvegica]|uniref:Uncharacterized protein n=1 Tax=Meganyctiphanes norvegica TaxID=48144 RepID=A0AAV2RGI0_MEGNR
MRLLLIIAGTATALLAVASAELTQQLQQSDVDVEGGARGKFVFGSYRTTTHTVVQAATSTVFFSCLSGTGTALCTGKRKKRTLRNDLQADLLPGGVSALEGSLGGSDIADPLKLEAAGSGNADGKLGFTIWTTNRLTTSVTVFFTDTLTTIRLSYFCNAAGITSPNNCVGP